MRTEGVAISVNEEGRRNEREKEYRMGSYLTVLGGERFGRP